MSEPTTRAELQSHYDGLVKCHGACYCDFDELHCLAAGHAGRALAIAAKRVLASETKE